MQISATKTVNVQAKTLSLHLKVSDMFTAHVKDENNMEIGGQDDGYVPSFMPGDHYGDYVILDIDLDTGNIVNWQTPSAGEIEEFISPDETD